MTDTGQIPGEGLPESAGMVEQPGVPAHGAYTYLSETTTEDEDLLLLPGAQGAWGNEVPPPAPEPVVETVHEPGPHEISGRDSGSVDLSAVRLPEPPAPVASASAPAAPPRRPLHLGPPIPDSSASPVRSLADRGAVGAPVRPATGPEYLDLPQPREASPQGATGWETPAQDGARDSAQGVVRAPVGARGLAAETVVPTGERWGDTEADAGTDSGTGTGTGMGTAGVPAGATAAVGAAQAAVARLATGAVAEAGPEVVGPEVAGPEVAGPEVVGPEAAGPEAAVADEGRSVDGAWFAPPGVENGSPDGPAPETPRSGEEGFAPHTAAVHGGAESPPAGQSAGGAHDAESAAMPEGGPASEDGRLPEGAGGVGDSAGPGTGVSGGPVGPGGPVPGTSEVSVAEETPVPAGAPDQAPGAGAEADGVPDPGHDTAPADATAHHPIGRAPEGPPASDVVPAPDATPSPDAVHAPGVPQAPEAGPADEGTPNAASGAPATPPPATGAQGDGSAQDAAGHLVDTAAAPEPGTAPATAMPLPASAALPPEASAPLGATAAGQAQAPLEAVPFPDAAGVSAPPRPDHDRTVAGAHGDTAVTPEPSPREAQPEPAVPHHDQPHPPAAEAHQPPPGAPSAPAADAVPVQPTDQAPAPDAPAEPLDEPTPDTDTPHAEQPQPARAPEPTAPGADPHVPLPPSADPATAPAAPPPELLAPASPLPVAGPDEPAASEQSPGGFVPVEGVLPATPHPAPTPPQGMTLLPDGQSAQAPGATVPAAPDDDPELVQQAADLDTRAADPEEHPAAGPVADVRRQPAGPAAAPYEDAEREAVLKVMRERRDVRNGFRGDPIPHEVLLRVLEAAHTAPSVGLSQPWDFVVIRSDETRNTMHELAMRQREAYAKSLPKGRAKQFKELKIEAILDTPVNIVVTADPTRGGRHTLGRHTQPQMAPYSAALAVENLWLAARAEGLGVGWVSFFDEREMVRALGLPEHLEVIAYLCLGYVDEFPDEPELLEAGWSQRRPLSWVVHEETYGRRALPGEDPHDLLAETVAQIRPLDAKALGEAWERQKRMTKPAGALGMLEIISAQLSGLSRQCPPPIPEPAAVAIFAGDHGVHAQGVTPWPQEVTAQMVANFLGGGAVCNAFAGQVGAEVCVIDVGVATDLPATPGLLPRKVRAGTSDMTTGPAMTREEARQAIEVGIDTARDLVAAGNKALLTGEMGIANTTASAALIAVFTDTDPSEVTGRGTGINDETLARKTEVVRRAIELHQPDPADPVGVLAAVGGFEHAALVGLLLGGASLRTPVILDGVSAGAAALVARAIAPEVLAACIAGHRSAEPGHVAALNKLGLRPLVDLDLRLGEGTGALLALPLVQSTARAMHEVATFDSAGVTEK